MPKYKAIGVDRASQMDTVLVIEATTEANARAKAELRGVLVTEIRTGTDFYQNKPASPTPNPFKRKATPLRKTLRIIMFIITMAVFAIVWHDDVGNGWTHSLLIASGWALMPFSLFLSLFVNKAV